MKILGFILVIKRSGAEGTRYPLSSANPSCTIGRGIECDIRVQLPAVSLQHCRIEVEQSGKAYLTNISASSPTHLNKQKLCPKEIQMLCHEDIINVADRQLKWEYPKESLLVTTTRREKDDYKILTPRAKAPICYQNDDQLNGVGIHIGTGEQNGLDSRRKRVSFGRDLHPEHFDKKLPPSTPVRKGEKPDNRTDLFVSPLSQGIGRKNTRVSATPSASTIVEEGGLETPTKSLLRRRSPTPVKPYLARSLGLLTPKSSPEANGVSSLQTPKAILDNQISEICTGRRLSNLSPKANTTVTNLSSPKVTETPTAKPLRNASPKAEASAKQETPKSGPKVSDSKISKLSTPKAQIASNSNSPKTRKSPELSKKMLSPSNSSPKEDTNITEADSTPSDARQSRSKTPKSQKLLSEKSSCELSQKDSAETAFVDFTPKVLRSSSPRAASWIRSRSQSPVSSASRNSSPKSPSNTSPKSSRDSSSSNPQGPRTSRGSSPKTPVGVTRRTSATKTSLNGPKTSGGSNTNTPRNLSSCGHLSLKDSVSCNSLDEIPKVLRSFSPRIARTRSQSPVTPRNPSPKSSKSSSPLTPKDTFSKRSRSSSPKTPMDEDPKHTRSSSPKTPMDEDSKHTRSSSPKTPKDENSKTPITKTSKHTELKASRSSSPRTPRAADLRNSSTPSSSDQKDTISKTSSPKTPRDLSPNTSDEVTSRIFRSSSPRAIRRMRSRSPVSGSPKTLRHSSPNAKKYFSSKTSVCSSPKTPGRKSKTPQNISPKTPMDEDPKHSRSSSPKTPMDEDPKHTRSSSPKTPKDENSKTPITKTSKHTELKASRSSSPRTPRAADLRNSSTPSSSDQKDTISKTSSPKTPRDLSPNTSDEVTSRIFRSSSPRAIRRMRSRSPVSGSPKTSRHSSPNAKKYFSSKTSVCSSPKTPGRKSKTPQNISPKTPMDEDPKHSRSSSPKTPMDEDPKHSSPKTPKDENSKTPITKTSKHTELKASRSSSPRTPRAADLRNSSTPSSSDQKDTISKTSSPKTPRDLSPNTSDDITSRIFRSSSPRAIRRMRSRSPVSGSPKTSRHSSPNSKKYFSSKTSMCFSPKTPGSKSKTPQNTSSKASPAKATIGSIPVAIKGSSPTLSKDSSTKKMKTHVKNTNRRASLAVHLGQSPRKSLKPRRSLSSRVLLNIAKNAKPRTPKISTLKTPEKPEIIVATPGSIESSPMILEIHDLNVSNSNQTGTPSKRYVRSDILQLLGINRTSPRKLELGKRSTPLRMSSPSKNIKTPPKSTLSTPLEKKSATPLQSTPKTPVTVVANRLDTPKKDGSGKQMDILTEALVDKICKAAKKQLPEIEVNSPGTSAVSECVSTSLLKKSPCRTDVAHLLGKSRASVRQLSLGKRTMQHDSPVLSPSKRTPKPSYGLKRKASMSPESPVRKKIKTGSKTPLTGSKSLSGKKLSVRKEPLGKSTPKKSWADVLKRGLMAHGVPAAKAQQVSFVMNKARIARQNKRPGNERTPPTFSTEIPSSFNFGKSTGHANSPASIFIHKKITAKTPKMYRRGRKLPVNTGLEKGSIDNIELEGLAKLLNTPESKERNLVQKTTGWTLPDIVSHYTPLSKAVRLRQMLTKNTLTPGKGNETPGARSDVSSMSTVTPQRTMFNDSVDYSPSQFSPVTPPDGNYTNFDFSSVKTPDVTEENFVSPLITPDHSNKTPERLLRSSQNKSPVVSPVSLETDATTFDFEDTETPNVSRDMFVSPMSTKSKRFSPRTQGNIHAETPKLMVKMPNSPRQNNSVQSFNEDNTVMSTNPVSTGNSDSDDVESSSSRRRIHTGHTADYTDVRGMKRLLRTPKAEKESPPADYTNVEGMKRLLRTPKSTVESPEVNMVGIRKLLKTPRVAPAEHEADYTYVEGVKKLLSIPGLLDSVPEADYTDVAGMKKLLKTPKVTGSDYTDVRGIRNLLKTPQAMPKSPKADYTNVAGMKKLLATPRTEVFENEADYTNVAGIKKLLKTPHRTERERNPVSDYSNIHGLRKLMKTPNRSNEALADYTSPKGLKKLMATPRQRSSEPLSDYTNVAGVKKLMRTPHSATKSPQADYTQVEGIRNLMKTPKTNFQHMDIEFEGVSQLWKSPIVNNATVEQINDLVKDAATPTSLRKSSRTKKAVSPASSSPSENVPPEEDLKMIVDLIRNEDLKGAISPRRSRRNVKASPVKDDTPKKAKGARKTALTISTPDVDVESTVNNTPTKRSTRGKRKAAEEEISTKLKKLKKGEDSADAQTTESINDDVDSVRKQDAVEFQVLTENLNTPVLEQIATPKRRGRGKKEVRFEISAPQEVTPVSTTRGRRNQRAKECADVSVASECKKVTEELANGNESKAVGRRRGRGKKDLETEAEKESISKEGTTLMNDEGHIIKQTRTRRGKTTLKKLPEEISDKLILESNQDPAEEADSLMVTKTDKIEPSGEEQESKHLDRTKTTGTWESSSSSEDRKAAKRGCEQDKELAVDVQPPRTRRGRGRHVNDLKESGEVNSEKPSPIVRRGRAKKTNDSEALEPISPPTTKSTKSVEEMYASPYNTLIKKVEIVAEESSPVVRRGRARKTKDTTAKSEEETTSVMADSADTKKDVKETKENKVKASARSRRGQKRQASEEREVTTTPFQEDNVEKASSKNTKAVAKSHKSEDKAEKQEVKQPACRTRGKKNEPDTSSKAEADVKDEDVAVTRPRRGNKKQTQVVAECLPALPEKATRRTRSRK